MCTRIFNETNRICSNLCICVCVCVLVCMYVCKSARACKECQKVCIYKVRNTLRLCIRLNYDDKKIVEFFKGFCFIYQLLPRSPMGPPLNPPLFPLEEGGGGPPRQSGKGAPIRGRKFGPSYSYIIAGCDSAINAGPFGPDESSFNICGPFCKRGLFLLGLPSSRLCSSQSPFVVLFISLPIMVELIDSSNNSFSAEFTLSP
ncbi:hypothetical protein PUN28_019859 [Cardiocondyla obscurior]|uniref:Uncharacterized protein n=1 Tax=Cardiocondyla obscurior TaxID=286306 RepID=A0AAW2EBX0_9HYME